jgi:hypothetical protein
LEVVFSVRYVQKIYNEGQLPFRMTILVEAGKNTPTVALRVVKRDRKGTQCPGVLLGTLFLGDINTGLWPSRLGESQMRQ